MKTTKASNRGHSRREIMATAAAALVAAAAPTEQNVSAQTSRASNEPFGYCLNTSTISGQNLGIVNEVKITAEAGFKAIEPWLRDIEDYQKKGGSIKDLRKLIEDHGLAVPSAIGFAPWIVDDDAQRAKALEQAKREMDLVSQIGGGHIAAPPAGAQDKPGPALPVIAERYRALLELGEQMNVVPELELWGFSKTLSKLGEVAYVALEAHHPKSCMLLDIYHLYKGGSDFDELRLLNGAALPVIHTNDYPSDPPRPQITDAFRVLPGDGTAPLDQIFRTLRDTGFRGYLSVELFNRDYWKQSAPKVAKAAFDKTRAAVIKALS
jgi:2-keto-myo-inositol isomerase